MQEKPKTSAREALLLEDLLGFHADIESARKLAATTSGKGYNRDRMIANSLPDLGVAAEPAAQS